MAKASRRTIVVAGFGGAVPILIALLVIATVGQRLGEVASGLIGAAAVLASALTVRFLLPEGDGPGSDGFGGGVGM
ncbi:hypothetical protein ACIQNU_40840 [Streptomyces sp. NPDC091292]|uniref:hypothetical protein n=1 Tax=Streptomyces sp. NPDC091292 TaxID=3365991 RepID=UPI00380A22C4